MKQLQFSIEIFASKEKVWQTLRQDQTFRKWAGIIDPGTYMKGKLIEGSTVQFISEENGYGVTSFVAKLIPHEYLLLEHQSDTKDSGKENREEQWSGGSEEYALTESLDNTTLKVTFDVPEELETYFNQNYPKALETVKSLTEQE